MGVSPYSSPAALAPDGWRAAVTSTECTLHQLSPYIGKLKSSIARSLIERYTERGETVVDPFAGSGTVSLEALLSGRRTLAFDISPYSELLCRAKLAPPKSRQLAVEQYERLLQKAKDERIDVDAVPAWVKVFFHRKTLAEILKFAQACKRSRAHFHFAALLGILHHQRPGFLSFPASHLTPYLRTNKYPRAQHPDLYSYRALEPRLLAKIDRLYRRVPDHMPRGGRFLRTSIHSADFGTQLDAIITSPPYMNALDYVRDNRLRFWFIDPRAGGAPETLETKSLAAFKEMMASLARKASASLRVGGRLVLVVGERTARKHLVSAPGQISIDAVAQYAPGLRLIDMMRDEIPDIRRARREMRGTKSELILAYEKTRS